MDLLIRLGFLIDFLSHAAIVGFMGGAAITITLQQLKGFLGIEKFTKKTDVISVIHSVLSSAHHGVCFLFFLSIPAHNIFYRSFILKMLVILKLINI